MNQPYTYNDLKAECDRWNEANPVGCPVTVELDNGEKIETKTRSQAGILAGSMAVVHVEAYPNPVVCSLHRVTPRKAEA